MRDLRLWFTCPTIEFGFVRLSSNPAFSSEHKTPRQACALLRKMLEHPDHRFIKDSIPTTDLTFCRLADNLHGHKQIIDAYLVAVAITHQLKLVTFDRKIRGFSPEADVVELLSM